jgi:hypothetical protein
VTWLRLDDGFDNDPALLHIARSRAEADRILGIVTALMLYCARHRTDGYLPALVVREHVRSAGLLDRLTAHEKGRPGLLHPRGVMCGCMRAEGWPSSGGDYAVHAYLAMNPTRAETDVARAKAAELRDRELLHAVRTRDGDTCRYCGVEVNPFDRRSLRGMVYDHVDPAVACGASNLVVACRGCNSRKGPRTPEAAGMVLLPEPGSGTDLEPFTGSDLEPTTGLSRDGTGRDGSTARPAAGSAGEAGHRDTVGPATPRTRSDHPDPYRRTAITGPHPEHHAGLPEDGDYPPPGGI